VQIGFSPMRVLSIPLTVLHSTIFFLGLSFEGNDNNQPNALNSTEANHSEDHYQ